MTHVHHTLKNLKSELGDLGDVKSIAITRLATGVGGLDWSDVKPELESSLADLNIPIYIYETFQQGVEAQAA